MGLSVAGAPSGKPVRVANPIYREVIVRVLARTPSGRVVRLMRA